MHRKSSPRASHRARCMQSTSLCAFLTRSRGHGRAAAALPRPVTRRSHQACRASAHSHLRIPTVAIAARKISAPSASTVCHMPWHSKNESMLLTNRYWPLWPRTCPNKLVDCIMAYTNDGIACGTDYYMYEAMVSEGNDARLLSFSGDGGHSNPKNKMERMHKHTRTCTHARTHAHRLACARMPACANARMHTACIVHARPLGRPPASTHKDVRNRRGLRAASASPRPAVRHVQARSSHVSAMADPRASSSARKTSRPARSVVAQRAVHRR